MKTVRNLKPGNKGIIKSIKGKGAIRRRLLDMGITKGEVIEVIKTAPLGDPIEVVIRGYNLSFRKAEAEQIEIE